MKNHSVRFGHPFWRDSLSLASVFLLLFLVSSPLCAQVSQRLLRGTPVTYNQVGPRIRIFSEDIQQTVKLFVISDTHLWMSDNREDPYRKYSERMASAYHNNRHFQTGEPTTSQESFLRTLDLAKQSGADAIVLMGDIVSYPSEAAIEFVVNRLDSLGIPYYYTFGNHDWHYEGMEGTEIDLRAEWAQRRFQPLFRGYNPYRRVVLRKPQSFSEGGIQITDHNPYRIRISRVSVNFVGRSGGNIFFIHRLSSFQKGGLNAFL